MSLRKIIILAGVVCVAVPSSLRAIPSASPSLTGSQNSGDIHNDSTLIRVLIDSGRHGAVLRSKSGKLLVKFHDAEQARPLTSAVALRISPKSSADSHRHLLVNGKRAANNSVEIYPSRGTSIWKMEGQAYRGHATVHITGSRILIVNTLTMGDYLRGTLANEMNASWHQEALKAQAVVSRSYANYMRKNPRNSLYDLRKDVYDQVYRGSNTESKIIDRVVNSTRSRFLTVNGTPVKTYFHSRCGGMTEKPEHVWQRGQLGHRKQVDCPYCRRYPAPWSATFTLKRLSSLFGLVPKPKMFSVRAKRSPSGRISELEFQLDEKSRTFSGDEFRRRLGYSRIKSTRFHWRVSRGQVRFEGVGSGHGVGMCQWGAQYLARRGTQFQQILRHYYPGSRLSLKK